MRKDVTGAGSVSSTQNKTILPQVVCSGIVVNSGGDVVKREICCAAALKISSISPQIKSAHVFFLSYHRICVLSSPGQVHYLQALS